MTQFSTLDPSNARNSAMPATVLSDTFRPHHDRRHRQHITTTLDDLQLASPESSKGSTIPGNLLRRTRTLQRQHPTTHTHQRQRPPRQLLQRRHRTRGHHIGTPRLLDDTGILGTPPHHRHVRQPHRIHELLQIHRPPKQRLHQRHPHIRPRNRQRNPRQPRPRPHIHHRLTGPHQLTQHRTIEHMPHPQPRHLPRTDQPPHHTIRRQRRVIRLRQPHPITEHPPRRTDNIPLLINQFHVKHPPQPTTTPPTRAAPFGDASPPLVRTDGGGEGSDARFHVKHRSGSRPPLPGSTAPDNESRHPACIRAAGHHGRRRVGTRSGAWVFHVNPRRRSGLRRHLGGARAGTGRAGGATAAAYASAPRPFTDTITAPNRDPLSQ